VEGAGAEPAGRFRKSACLRRTGLTASLAAIAMDAVMQDAWDLKRAALFLGLSPRTLERYVARRMIPCILYPSATKDDARPRIAFDPDELAAWRDQRKVGRMQRAG